jgi:hypothetical protein
LRQGAAVQRQQREENKRRSAKRNRLLEEIQAQQRDVRCARRFLASPAGEGVRHAAIPPMQRATRRSTRDSGARV